MNLTPLEICVVVVGALLAVASAVNTLGAAVEKIVKAVKAAKAPENLQNGRLKALEDDMTQVKQYLTNDNARLDKLESSTRITMRAQLALLSHGLDGNNVHQMEEAKKEIENYLINR